MSTQVIIVLSVMAALGVGFVIGMLVGLVRGHNTAEKYFQRDKISAVMGKVIEYLRASDKDPASTAHAMADEVELVQDVVDPIYYQEAPIARKLNREMP